MRISDWSSDVCSSDLAGPTKMRSTPPDRRHRGGASWLVSLVGREVAQQVGGPIEPLGPEPGLGEALRSGLHEHAVYERLIGGRRHAAEGERHWTETQLEQPVAAAGLQVVVALGLRC